MSISVTGLEKIVGGLNYQAWLVVGDNANFFGYPLFLFNIDEAGRMVDPATDTLLVGPYEADAGSSSILGVAISLEITDTLVASSSYTFILGGENIQGTANLTAEDWIAFDRDLSNTAGEYILSTPTDEDPDNELSGVWFTDESLGAPSLDLLDAPKGWIYEGWIEVNGRALSTGKFVYPNLPDSIAPYSGGGEAPLFPGEDFLFYPPQGVTFPIDPAGGTVFVSIEPLGDWDVFPDDPFFLRILEGQVPESPASLVPYSMTSLIGQLPSGTATIQDL